MAGSEVAKIFPNAVRDADEPRTTDPGAAPKNTPFAGARPMRVERNFLGVVLLIVPVRDPFPNIAQRIVKVPSILGIRPLSNGMWTIAVLEQPLVVLGLVLVPPLRAVDMAPATVVPIPGDIVGFAVARARVAGSGGVLPLGFPWQPQSAGPFAVALCLLPGNRHGRQVGVAGRRVELPADAVFRWKYGLVSILAEFLVGGDGHFRLADPKAAGDLNLVSGLFVLPTFWIVFASGIFRAAHHELSWRYPDVLEAVPGILLRDTRSRFPAGLSGSLDGADPISDDGDECESSADILILLDERFQNSDVAAVLDPFISEPGQFKASGVGIYLCAGAFGDRRQHAGVLTRDGMVARVAVEEDEGAVGGTIRPPWQIAELRIHLGTFEGIKVAGLRLDFAVGLIDGHETRVAGIRSAPAQCIDEGASEHTVALRSLDSKDLLFAVSGREHPAAAFPAQALENGLTSATHWLDAQARGAGIQDDQQMFGDIHLGPLMKVADLQNIVAVEFVVPGF